MPLNALELRQVCAELDAGLRGAFVQNVFCPTGRFCYLKLRQAGQSTLLCASVEAGAARISVAEDRSRIEGKPPGLQFKLRKTLIGARLARIEPIKDGAKLRFERGSSGHVLRVAFLPPSIELTAEERGEPSGPLEDLGEDAPRVAPHRSRDSAPEDKPGNRLEPIAGHRFPYAAAAEALLGEKSQARVELLRNERLRALSRQLARLERTISKVRVEAARGERAEEHRHYGELLAQNPKGIPRGADAVELPDYSLPNSPRVSVPLDPKRAPQEQAAWHFHQYRRLRRAGEIANQRLGELENQGARLAQRIEEASTAPLETIAPLAPRVKSSRARSKALPYREYRALHGARIWVGKGGAKNDELTFKIAHPNDFWLHARGVSGAHVVVPVTSKQSEMPGEVLIDAAHLALFHSRAKNEPRGEVSYTRVRHLRRQKGGAPGQVIYSQERTINVRVEADRLRRLTQTEQTSEIE